MTHNFFIISSFSNCYDEDFIEKNIGCSSSGIYNDMAQIGWFILIQPFWQWVRLRYNEPTTPK